MRLTAFDVVLVELEWDEWVVVGEEVGLVEFGAAEALGLAAAGPDSPRFDDIECLEVVAPCVGSMDATLDEPDGIPARDTRLRAITPALLNPELDRTESDQLWTVSWSFAFSFPALDLRSVLV